MKRESIIAILALSFAGVAPAEEMQNPRPNLGVGGSFMDGEKQERLDLIMCELTAIGANLPENYTAPVPEVLRLKEALGEWEATRYDYTTGRNNICPVHGVKMAAKELPLRFGYREKTLPGAAMREQQFPFALEWIYGGCLGSTAAAKGKQFVCAKCVKAQAEWQRKHRDSR